MPQRGNVKYWLSRIPESSPLRGVQVKLAGKAGAPTIRGALQTLIIRALAAAAYLIPRWIS